MSDSRLSTMELVQSCVFRACASSLSLDCNYVWPLSIYYRTSTVSTWHSLHELALDTRHYWKGCVHAWAHDNIVVRRAVIRLSIVPHVYPLSIAVDDSIVLSHKKNNDLYTSGKSHQLQRYRNIERMTKILELDNYSFSIASTHHQTQLKIGT